jgi:hypothetical protein
LKKVHIEGGRAFIQSFTRGLLEFLAEKAGIEIVPEEQAEALWFSCCDPDDIKDLERIRQRARGRPVIMGGVESYNGVPYLAWVDAVVVGEGLEFIRAWGRDPSEALALPCVLTRDRLKAGTSIYPSYEVPYREGCLVKMPSKGNLFYYLAGRGCKRKCKFCHPTEPTLPRFSEEIDGPVCLEGRLSTVFARGSPDSREAAN